VVNKGDQKSTEISPESVKAVRWVGYQQRIIIIIIIIMALSQNYAAPYRMVGKICGTDEF